MDINVNVSLSVESRECIDRLVNAMNGAYTRFDLVHEMSQDNRSTDQPIQTSEPMKSQAKPEEPEVKPEEPEVKPEEPEVKPEKPEAKPEEQTSTAPKVGLDQLRKYVQKSTLGSKKIVELLTKKYKVEKVSDLADDQIADFVIDLGVSVEE